MNKFLAGNILRKHYVVSVEWPLPIMLCVCKGTRKNKNQYKRYILKNRVPEILMLYPRSVLEKKQVIQEIIIIIERSSIYNPWAKRDASFMARTYPAKLLNS